MEGSRIDGGSAAAADRERAASVGGAESAPLDDAVAQDDEHGDDFDASASGQRSALAAKGAAAKRKTLWIGDLAYWMDEAYVYYAFSSVYKSVAHVKIIRSRVTGLSEGYGFIEFNSREEADFALRTFHGQPMPGTLHGYTLNWAVPKSTPTSTRTSEDRQRDEVDEKGDTVSSMAPSTPKRAETSSRTVLAPLSEAGSDSSETVTNDDESRTESVPAEFSVFVGDLGPDVNEEVLCAHFKSKCATAHNARIVIDLKTLRPKGYGFVDFDTEEDYQLAMSEFPGSRCGSSERLIRVCNANDRRPEGVIDTTRFHDFEDLDPSNTTIFVGNLDANVTEDQLRVVFEEFGEVAYVKVTPKKGCGFVHFFRRDDAVEAISTIHGTIIGSKKVRLSWGRHNATKCAITSMYQQQQLEYVPEYSGVYVSTPPPGGVYVNGVVPAIIPGMRFPMTSAASVYSMYGGVHVMPPPPPVSLTHMQSP